MPSENTGDEQAIPDQDTVAARRRRIIASAGALTGTYEPGYLDSLRDEWPE